MVTGQDGPQDLDRAAGRRPGLACAGGRPGPAVAGRRAGARARAGAVVLSAGVLAAGVLAGACGATATSAASSGRPPGASVPAAGTTSALGSSPTAILAAAATHTAAARTAQLEVTFTAVGSGLPTGDVHTTVTATGAVDFGRDAATLTLHGPGTTVHGVPLQVVLVGGAAYVDAAAVHAGAAGYVPASQVGAAAGAALGNLDLSPGSLASVSPVHLLDALRAERAATVTTGVRVGGVEATEVSGTLANAESLLAAGNAGPSSSAPVVPATTHVWVDGRGRAVRLQASIDATSIVRKLLDAAGAAASSAGGVTVSGGSVHLTATIEETLSHFGAPVTIPAVGGSS